MVQRYIPFTKTISPDKSWNKSGNCGLWNIVMAIIFEQVKRNKNDTGIISTYRLKQIYKKFNSIGDQWLANLQEDLIINNRASYNTKSEAEGFISAVYGRVAEMLGTI